MAGTPAASTRPWPARSASGWLRVLRELLVDAATRWSADNATRMGASLAYYTIFSLAPLLVIVIGVAGIVLGEASVQARLIEQVHHLVGPDGARFVQSLVEGKSNPSGGVVATVVGVVTLLLGATGVFAELQAALNQVWDVKPKETFRWTDLLRTRLISFALVLAIGFLLLVSLVVSAAVAAAGTFLSAYLPLPAVLLEAVHWIFSFLVITALFAVMYRLLPDADIAWGDVLLGAAVTAVLFTVGKSLIGFYLGSSGVTSAYGAAGALVVLLVWIYYSSLILFFGAEFTRAYAVRYGSRPPPAEHAEPREQPGARHA